MSFPVGSRIQAGPQTARLLMDSRCPWKTGRKDASDSTGNSGTRSVRAASGCVGELAKAEAGQGGTYITAEGGAACHRRLLTAERNGRHDHLQNTVSPYQVQRPQYRASEPSRPPFPNCNLRLPFHLAHHHQQCPSPILK